MHSASAKTVARFGVLAALALILGLVESQFTLVPSVPGIKLGLSNIVLLMALAAAGAPRAFELMLVKVFLGGMLYAGATGMLYSLAGGVLSVLVMHIVLSRKSFGFVGVSVAGATAHLLGQICMSRVLLGSWAAAMQLPVLLVSGVITGALTGTASAYLARAFARTDAALAQRLCAYGLLGGKDTRAAVPHNGSKSEGKR